MAQRILIIESELPVASPSTCGTALNDQGYVVDTATDGAEALVKIAARPPDLVILDARDPAALNVEWCRRIKSDKATRDIKVVVMTSSGEWGRVFEAFAAGCDDYLVEPFDRTELALKLKELFKFSHLRPGAVDVPVKGTI